MDFDEEEDLPTYGDLEREAQKEAEGDRRAERRDENEAIEKEQSYQTQPREIKEIYSHMAFDYILPEEDEE